MPNFSFKAQKQGGEIYESKRNALDKFVLARDLKAEGDTIIFAEEIHTRKFFDLNYLLGLLGGIPMHEKVIFAKNLGAMIEAGLPLSRALSVINRQTKNKSLKKTSGLILEGIKKGKSFSENLKDFPATFSPLFVSMVRAGEEGGRLAESLRIVGDQMNKNYLLQKKIKGAMMYPAVIIIVMIIIAILMLIYVIPGLTETFREFKATLPWSTRLVIGASDFMRDHSFFALGGLALSGVGLYLFSRSGPGKKIFDFTILRIPIIGKLIRETNAARTARTLSSLLSSGVDVVYAIEITGDVLQNGYYKEVLKEAGERIKKGEPISDVFAKNEHLYPVFVSEMIMIGEETGKLGDMLSNIANFYEEEVDQKTKDMSSIIEPFLMVFIGAVVGFFAVSMILPIYSLVNTIN